MGRGSEAERPAGITRKRLMDVYDRLYARFGPQEWWPGETAFEVCVGAILVQNTSWANAAQAIANLKKAGLLTERALAKARVSRLARLVRPARFFNVKARRIKGFAAWLRERHEGDVGGLLRLPAKELGETLLALEGVGRETADSIVLYAAGQAVFVVDAYTKRIFSRLGHFRESKSGEKDYLALQEAITARLPQDAALFNEYHALLARLGNALCRPRPKCAECPLVEICPYPSGGGRAS